MRQGPRGLDKSVFSEHGQQYTSNYNVDSFEGSMQIMHGAEVTQSTGWKPVQQQLEHSKNEMKCVRQLFMCIILQLIRLLQWLLTLSLYDIVIDNVVFRVL